MWFTVVLPSFYSSSPFCPFWMCSWSCGMGFLEYQGIFGGACRTHESFLECTIQHVFVLDTWIYFMWYLTSRGLIVDLFRTGQAVQIHHTPKTSNVFLHFSPDLVPHLRRKNIWTSVVFWMFTSFHQLLVYFGPFCAGQVKAACMSPCSGCSQVYIEG